MSEDGLGPVIHAPARLRLMVTLAALPDGDNLSFTRMQDLIGLTPGNLITQAPTARARLARDPCAYRTQMIRFCVPVPLADQAC
jgi:hypothetical protein